MCDEHTLSDADAALAARGLTRRDFTVMGAAAVLASAVPRSAHAAQVSTLIQTGVEFQTADGTVDPYFAYPASGMYPAVILWPDIAGLRPAKEELANRLAWEGFAVLAVNQYYRSAPAPVMETFSEWRTPEGRARLQPMIAQVTPDAVMRDARAFVGFLDQQAGVDTARGIGVHGYCMGGPIAVRSAAAAPDRIKAVASFHGGGLATDKPDSPHRLLAGTQASYLIDRKSTRLNSSH